MPSVRTRRVSARRAKLPELVAGLFEELPDEPPSRAPTIAVDDRSAVQRAIRKRLGASTPKR